MKKTLAIVLALMMVVALTVSASAATTKIAAKVETGATTVKITKVPVGDAAAEVVYLGIQPVLDDAGKMTKDDAGKYVYDATKDVKTLACATGTMTFDSKTGTLTLDGVTGIQSIFTPDAGNLTVDVKGTNTLDATKESISIKTQNGDLFIKGNGTLNVNNSVEGSYPIVSQVGGVAFSGKVTVNMNVASKNCAVHSARGTLSYVLVEDDVKLNIKNTAGGRGIYLAGFSSDLIITDNAVVDIETKSGDGIYVLADRIDPTVDNTLLMEVSKNAQLKIVAGSCGIRTNQNATGDGGEVGDIKIIFKDEAKVDITAPGQVVYAAANTTANALIEIDGNANLKIVNNGKYAGLDLRGKVSNTLNFKGGTVEVALTNAENTLGAINCNGADATALKITVADGATIKAGADAATAAAITADKLGVDAAVKYVSVSVPKVEVPETSDASVAAIAAVALISVAAAVVVLRKRVNG